ncbi:hypothetical protein ACQUJO_12325 [Ralstonia pseudosolanacearum]
MSEESMDLAAESKPSKTVQLKDSKIADLPHVPLTEWLEVVDQAAMLFLASMMVGYASGSFALGLGTFCALRYVRLKIKRCARKKTVRRPHASPSHSSIQV